MTSKWLDGIPNSFSKWEKTDIVNKIFDKAYPDGPSVATFTEAEMLTINLEPSGYASKGKDDGDPICRCSRGFLEHNTTKLLEIR